MTNSPANVGKEQLLIFSKFGTNYATESSDEAFEISIGWKLTCDSQGGQYSFMDIHYYLRHSAKRSARAKTVLLEWYVQTLPPQQIAGTGVIRRWLFYPTQICDDSIIPTLLPLNFPNIQIRFRGQMAQSTVWHRRHWCCLWGHLIKRKAR